MQKLGRAPEQRTFSERVIDKYLRKIEKDTHLEKLETKYRNSPKKIKTNEEKTQNEGKQATQNANVSPNEALDKILKHLGNAQKAPKAINLISQLLDVHAKEIHSHHLLETLFQIMKSYEYFIDINSKKTVTDIFHKIQTNTPLKNLTHKEEFLFDIMNKYAEYIYLLNTDDSYQFHASVKKVNEFFDEFHQEYLNKYNDEDFDDDQDEKSEENEEILKEKDIKLEEDVLNKIKNKLQKKEMNKITEEEVKKNEETQKTPTYEYKLSEELSDFLKKYENLLEYKKNIIHSLVLEAYKMYSKEWAKSSINILLNEIFYQKDIFNENQVQLLDKIMKEVSLKKQKNINKNLVRNNLDEKILANPLISKNEVTDARSLVVMDDGLGTWSSRQCGL